MTKDELIVEIGRVAVKLVSTIARDQSVEVNKVTAILAAIMADLTGQNAGLIDILFDSLKPLALNDNLGKPQ